MPRCAKTPITSLRCSDSTSARISPSRTDTTLSPGTSPRSPGRPSLATTVVRASPRSSLRLPEQVDHLATGQVRPERHLTGHVGKPSVQRDRLPPGVPAEESDLPGVGPEQAEEHPDGRRLPGAVGAQEAVHLPGGHLHVEAVERGDLAEPLDHA